MCAGVSLCCMARVTYTLAQSKTPFNVIRASPLGTHVEELPRVQKGVP